MVEIVVLHSEFTVDCSQNPQDRVGPIRANTRVAELWGEREREQRAPRSQWDGRHTISTYWVIMKHFKEAQLSS